jgi:DNA-binding IscR family transcriptional regulator
MIIIRIMRMGDGVEWALHSCTMLALLPPESALPAARLAEFHGVPAAYLAKHLQALSQAGIVQRSAKRWLVSRCQAVR